MNTQELALEKHRQWKGKLRIETACPLNTREDLSVAYTPGVAAPCLEIAKNTELSYEYTGRGNLVAVITDGTAVLGLGDIGPEAGMPVMEGKCALFKEFGNVDAIPLCIRSKDVGEIVRTVELLAGSFGGINLEDISAPRCFEIEEKLKQSLDIPVFHDDQHGTAIVMLAALINGLKLVNKKIEDIRVAVNGAGAAGLAVTKLLMDYGLRHVVLCDIHGILYEGRPELSTAQQELVKHTNENDLRGGLKEAVAGADVFLGLSAPNCLTGEMVKTMAKDAMVFACANPVPEILPEEAKAAGARIVGTGRSDFANQINNVLTFPGIFRGALDVRAKEINQSMKLAAARAIAEYVKNDQLSEEYIIPTVLDKDVSIAVAKAVAAAAIESGAACI